MDKNKVLELAKSMYRNFTFALQNREAGHGKAADKYEGLAIADFDSLIAELIES